MTVFNLTYYKALLDKCFYNFFQTYNNMFIKQDNKYVLCANMNTAKLQSIFKKLIKEEILKFVTKFDKTNPKWYIIIGSCIPKNNLLLKFKDKSFPQKLDKLITQTDLKYILKEKDIILDIQKLNYAIIEVFNQIFKHKHFLGSEYQNVIFLQHNQLDCYALFKTIKYLYGKSNCNTLFDDKQTSPIIAINDMIGKYVQNKIAMNKSSDFKLAVTEVKQYIDEKIMEAYCG